MEFKFELSDKVSDIITGFEGVIISRCQWLNGCNTYGVQPIKLKDGIPQDKVYFDEPQLRLVEQTNITPKRDAGGPVTKPNNPNRF